MSRRPSGLVIAALAALSLAPAATRAQTIGTVVLEGGAGASWQGTGDFAAVGPQLWFGAETVVDRRFHARLDGSVHRFGYTAPAPPPCPATRYCAPPVTSPLVLVAITGTIVWRDTTGTRPWYALAGLGAYSDANGRDANSRVGLSAGLGWGFGAHRDWIIEARLDLPYDAYGYGPFVPITVGRRFARFRP